MPALRCHAPSGGGVKAHDTLRLGAVGAMFGASFLFMRNAVSAFGPVPLIEMRIAIGALCLLPLLVLRGRMGQLSTHARQLMTLAVINVALPFPLMAFALQTMNAAMAAVLYATTPIFGTLVAFLWLGEPMRARRWLGLLLSVAGVALLVSAQGFRSQPVAIVAALAAALCSGIGANYAKARLAAVDPMVTASGSLAGATLVLAPLALQAWPASAPGAFAWLNVLAVGILSTGIAYVLLFGLIARIGPGKAITVTFLAPFFSALWAALFLHEAVSLHTVSGGALVLLGTWSVIGVWPQARRLTAGDAS